MRGVKMTAEEKVLAYDRNKAASNEQSRAYYIKNAERIREANRKRYEAIKYKANKGYKRCERKNGIAITMIDTTTGERFEYKSVQSCSNDMGITMYAIRKNLRDRIPFNKYMFEREALGK